MRALKDPDLNELHDLRARGEFFWVDLTDPSRDRLAQVADVLELHELAIEDTQEFGQRPKVDFYQREILMVYYGASTDVGGGPCLVEVHLHISDGFVLSVQRGNCRALADVRDSLDRRPPENEQALIYRVIDALTDSILDVLDGVTERVDDHEQGIFERPRARDRDDMAVLRRSLGSFRRVLVIQRQVFDRAVERLIAMSHDWDEAGAYYRDIGDHLWRAVDDVEAARDNLQGMLDTYTNEVQERLTIVATIFLPLTVLTGFFGMNFNWLVNHVGSAWTFWLIGVGGMIFSGTSIAFWLRHTGLWGGRSPRSVRRRSGAAS